MDPAATFQEYRALLFSIAYRMLGSADEADDVLQDAFLRFQAASGDEIRSPKAFLSTIVTRLSLNHLTSARATRERYVGQWLPEPVPTAELIGRNDPERHALDAESISIAFISLLQTLTPAERAVFLLHEVFDYGYGEIACSTSRSRHAGSSSVERSASSPRTALASARRPSSTAGSWRRSCARPQAVIWRG